MQKYTTDKITGNYVVSTGFFEVYLASDADAVISEAVRRERGEIIKWLKEEAGFSVSGECITYIRARGESKPEPRLGTNPPTATATMMKIEYCQECGTALGIVEEKPAKVFCNICGCVGHSSISCAYKPEPVLGTNPPEAVEIEHIMFSQHTNWEGRTSRLAEKLNELIDAVNGGKA
jgi:hypothetical protein